MHKTLFQWLALAVVIVLLAACGEAAAPVVDATQEVVPTPEIQASPTAEPVQQPTEATTTGVTIEIVTASETRTFTLEELQQLPVSEGFAGIKSSTGRITPPTLYTGVALSDLVALVGGLDETMGINVIADDGYSITYSYNQIMQGEFITYDPATGNELASPPALTLILAYARDGQPLPADSDGVLRLAIISPENNQVTDGHWSVKWVSRIDVRSFGENWSLHMEGAIPADIDRATYESCGAPGCHGATWTDDSAQVWTGIPLWLLVGWVDDEIQHEGPAFNEALAAAGYTIDVIASDGYTVQFDAARVARNDNIIVAYQVNGNPLAEDNYPLRLVGSDPARNERVGLITEIVVNLPAAPQYGTDPIFRIFGTVNAEQNLSEADLHAMEVVDITAEHPRDGSTPYSGIYLNALLTLAGVQDGAVTLVLTALDGYATEVPLADVLNCAECLLAFTDTPGSLYTVMPGFGGSAWVRDIVSIEVKLSRFASRGEADRRVLLVDLDTASPFFLDCPS
jgi:DMSO/TMAO reductase YedYZ molybdopterin-dependent catalytic subunit